MALGVIYSRLRADLNYIWIQWPTKAFLQPGTTETEQHSGHHISLQTYPQYILCIRSCERGWTVEEGCRTLPNIFFCRFVHERCLFPDLSFSQRNRGESRMYPHVLHKPTFKLKFHKCLQGREKGKRDRESLYRTCKAYVFNKGQKD